MAKAKVNINALTVAQSCPNGQVSVANAMHGIR